MRFGSHRASFNQCSWDPRVLSRCPQKTLQRTHFLVATSTFFWGGMNIGCTPLHVLHGCRSTTIAPHRNKARNQIPAKTKTRLPTPKLQVCPDPDPRPPYDPRSPWLTRAESPADVPAMRLAVEVEPKSVSNMGAHRNRQFRIQATPLPCFQSPGFARLRPGISKTFVAGFAGTTSITASSRLDQYLEALKPEPPDAVKVSIDPMALRGFVPLGKAEVLFCLLQSFCFKCRCNRTDPKL